jgi:hypothetical protein
MKSISKTKIMILAGGIVISTAYVIFILNDQKTVKTPQPESTAHEYKTEIATENSPAEDSKPTAGEIPKNANQKIPEAIPPAPLSDQDPFSPQNSTQRDSEQFREITEQTNIKIQAQMRQEEITSLKASITNDRALLKKIEDSGTGVEDYKFIEQNLKKRIQRLKLLTK